MESSSDSEDEEGLEAGKHDIIVLHEKAGNQSMFRSRKHHPMFPHHEDKVKHVLPLMFSDHIFLSFMFVIFLYNWPSSKQVGWHITKSRFLENSYSIIYRPKKFAVFFCKNYKYYTLKKNSVYFQKIH